MSGLNFSFTRDQEIFRESVREFGKREITKERIRRWDRDAKFDRELYTALAEQGLAGINLPAEYGGQGADSVTTGIAVEELAKLDFTVANLLIIDNILSGGILAAYARQKIKEQVLPPVCKGESHLGIALTEPHAGSDAANIKTVAKKEGDHYVLNGEKASISMIGVASYFTLFAKTNAAAGSHGVSAFLLPIDAEGVSTYEFDDLGYRPLRRGGIILNNVRLPEENLVGEENQGFKIVMRQFDFSKTLLALACVGTALAALDDARSYAEERTAFGSPILKFEAVQFRLVEHYTTLEAARLLCYRTLWLRDQGLPYTREAAMCKWWIPKISFEAVHDALITMGNPAYTTEHLQEKRLRDVLGIEIGDGTADIQKIVVAREQFGREFVPYR
ncbi:MAG: acyl-CoA dehydrogenase family protein [Thermoprotei archaeon]